MLGLKLKKYMSNFHQLEVMDNGSETHHHVGENFNSITWRFKVKTTLHSIWDSKLFKKLKMCSMLGSILDKRQICVKFMIM